MANPTKTGKFWREPRDPNTQCETPEEFRARAGEYTMRGHFEILQLARGFTAVDERYRFSLETQRRLEALQVQIMLELAKGKVLAREPEGDAQFLRFMAATLGAPR